VGQWTVLQFWGNVQDKSLNLNSVTPNPMLEYVEKIHFQKIVENHDDDEIMITMV
jgi:hypothetical protein